MRWELDYPRRRMILEQSSATDRPFESDMSGVTWIPENGTYRIKRVRPNSPASAEGLLEGDLLVSIDDSHCAAGCNRRRADSIRGYAGLV